MSIIDKILLGIISVIITYSVDETLFYREVKKGCKKSKGDCTICDCWSCPRKLYKDEYMEIRKNDN